MTGKQLEAARIARIGRKQWTKEDDEIGCIGMIHSILIYNFRPESENFPFPANNYYLSDYIKQFGAEKVEELWNEQVKDYQQAKVGYAGTDSEGCQYNYCRWADD